MALEDVWLLVKDFESMAVVPNMMTCTHLLGMTVKFAGVNKADYTDAIKIIR
jgi:hypothetical protein